MLRAFIGGAIACYVTALCAAPSFAVEQVKDTPLPLRAKLAFPELRLRRPLVVTHAGDGSQRVFVVSQYGVIHLLPKDHQATDAPVFLDIESRVVYKDKENEEGLLGLAFHPKYKQNGEFFLYYTTTDAPHTSVVCRFRVSQDPNKASLPATPGKTARVNASNKNATLPHRKPGSLRPKPRSLNPPTRAAATLPKPHAP